MSRTMLYAGLSPLLLMTLTVAGVAQTPQQRAAANAIMARGGTLHEAAVAAGGKYRTVDVSGPDWVDFISLKALAHASEAIILGTPTENTCVLSDDGQRVYTVYRVRVEQAVRGPYRPGDFVSVAMPGGMFGWPDGATVKVSTPDVRPMVNGNRYVLYLSGRHGQKNSGVVYVITGHAQGMFELKDDGSVQSFAASTHPFRKAGWKDHHDFVEAVRSSAADHDD